jgi:lysophospholipase L1-like esterase
LSWVKEARAEAPRYGKPCSGWLHVLAFVLMASSAGFAQTAAPAPTAASITTSPTLYGQGGNAQPLNPALPTVWIIGDSTVRNGQGNGSTNAPNGQWGWGAPIEYYFDRAKINVVNRALGGTSSRTFYNANWPAVLANVKKGDFVIMQFGHNDKNGDLTGANAGIGSLNGIGAETQDVPNARSGQPETVHTFGWYMEQYVEQAKAKGATPIVCSFIPRKIWENGKVIRANADYFPYADWAGDVAKKENVAYVDLNAITARKYNALGPDKVEPLFVPTPTEHTHTNWYGAIINAESVIGGLKLLTPNPLAAYLSDRGNAIPAADPAKSPLDGTSTVAATASADVLYTPAATSTTSPAPTAPAATPAAAVSTLARPEPVEGLPAKPTLYIISDSTANNNANGGMGWGKPFAEYFDPSKVRVVNAAIAGRSSRSFMAEGRWDPVVAQLKPGDFVLLQWGHNDTGTPGVAHAGDRSSLPGLGEEMGIYPTPPGTRLAFGAAPADATPTVALDPATPAGPLAVVHTYGWYLRKYIADAQARGARVFLLTVTVRDIWTNPNATFGTDVSATATIVSQKDNYNPADDKVERGLDDGHGHNYAELTRQLAKEQHLPLVDLVNINADKFEGLGREKTALLFQTQKTDHTHTNPIGADFNAASIVSGLKALQDSPFLALLSDKGKAVPAADAKYVADNWPTK